MDKKLTKDIVQNSFHNFTASLIDKIGSLVFTIIVARLLFPDLFGIYNLALSIILTLVTLTDLGINGTLTRFLSESFGKGKKGEKEARARFRFLLNLKLIFIGILAFALFFLAKVIATNIFNKPLLTTPLQIGALFLIAISLQGFFKSTFIALQKMKYVTFDYIIFVLIKIVFVTVGLLLLKSVGIVFAGLALSSIFAVLYFVFILFKKYGKFMHGKSKPIECNRMLTFFGFLSISSLSLVFFSHIDTFMLGYLIEDAQFLGFYGAIFSFVNTAVAFLGFYLVLLPVFTQLKKSNIKTTFEKISKYISIIVFPATAALLVVLIPLMKLIYGAAYVPQEFLFPILLTSLILGLLVIEGSLSPLYITLFNSREKPKIPALLVFIFMVVNIILNYFFITLGINNYGVAYGIVGAALATFISRILNFVVLVIISKKTFGISIKPKFIGKSLLISLLILVVMLLAFIFIKSEIIALIVSVVTAALIYFGLLKLFNLMNFRELRELIKS